MEPLRLRILHISDLHERVALSWMSEERRRRIQLEAASRYRVLGESFLEILRGIRQQARIDLLCFTGDVADWGLEDEYTRATRRIEEILGASGVTRERFFLVPGNHDVQRKRAEEAWEGLRKLLGEQYWTLSGWMAGLKGPEHLPELWPEQIGERTAAFWNWISHEPEERGLGRSELREEESRLHPRLGYRSTLEGLRLPFPVHVIGLDSAWLAGDNNDAGKLVLTRGQVDLLGTDAEGQPLSGFRLALLHHPLGDLADGAECYRRLSETVDLLLHGHQHEPVAEHRQDPDRALRVIAAGSLYEGDQGDRWLNSFHLIDVALTEQGRPLWYDVQFWGWSKNGHWHRTGAIYKAASDGQLRWWTQHGELWKKEQRPQLK